MDSCARASRIAARKITCAENNFRRGRCLDYSLCWGICAPCAADDDDDDDDEDDDGDDADDVNRCTYARFRVC